MPVVITGSSSGDIVVIPHTSLHRKSPAVMACREFSLPLTFGYLSFFLFWSWAKASFFFSFARVSTDGGQITFNFGSEYSVP